MNIKDLFHGLHTRVPAAFQPLHEQDAHHLDQEFLTEYIILPIGRPPSKLRLNPFRKVFRRLVSREIQCIEGIVYLIGRLVLPKVVHSLINIHRLGLLGEMKVLSQGLLYHLPGPSDNQPVRQIEELGGQLGDETTNGAVFILTPRRILLLAVRE